MVTNYYKSLRTAELAKLDTAKRGTWIHLEAPNQDELNDMAEKYTIDEGVLADALDQDEVPRLERDGEQTFVFVRFVYRKTNGEVDTAPLLFIFTGHVLITISPVGLPAIATLLRRKIAFATTQRTKLVLQLLALISDDYDFFIAQTTRQIKNIRSRLRGQTIRNQDLITFVTLEDELNEFLVSLQPMNAAMRRLLVGRYVALYEDDRELVEDVVLNNEQSIEACNSNMKSMINIREAYETISSNNLNNTIKMLTFATILVALPNVVTSFYGMNIPLPFQNTIWAVWFVVGITLAFILAVYVIARKRRIL